MICVDAPSANWRTLTLSLNGGKMSSSILTKAVRVQIKLGDIPLDVYQLPDGSYKLAGKQITDAIEKPNNSLYRFYGVKSLKALPHKGLGSIQSIKTNEGGSFIPVEIETATNYWLQMAFKGNVKAKAIAQACMVESIERRADHALGIMRSEQERNERLKLRMSRLLARSSWTDTLKQRHQDLFGSAPSSEQYKQWTGNVNLALFNRWHFYCDRDNMTIDQQRVIEQFEFMCCRMADKHPNATPEKILDIALSTF